MPEVLTFGPAMIVAAFDSSSLSSVVNILLILLGFSVVVFFHELGHFVVAKWAGVRVERFAVGFGPELWGFTRGETRYSFNLLPLGGYVKMLGQEDFEVDRTGELAASSDPRSFINKPVSHRMAVVSAGVIMNLIVAALLFMIVYMVGKEEVEPVVGQVLSDRPAAQAGLQVGDRVLRINDSAINSFDQIHMAVKLADPYEPLEFEVQRDDRRVSLLIQPTESEGNVLQVGILPAMTREVSYVDRYYLDQTPHPKPGDVIQSINGVPLREGGPYASSLMLRGRNTPSTVVVERPGAAPGEPQTFTLQVEKEISFDLNGRWDDPATPRDLLGLVPRVRATMIQPDGAADLAGITENDVIARWGVIEHPTPGQILDSIQRNRGSDVPVHVLRRGVSVGPLYYRARVTEDREGNVKPRPGFELSEIEQDAIVLSGKVDAQPLFGDPTAAAATPLGKGDRIIAAGGQALGGWAELAEYFRARAGETVELTYDPAGPADTAATTLVVPRSLSTILDLPAYSSEQQTFTFLLDGQFMVAVELQGKQGELPAFHWLAIRQYLAQRIGQTVQVTFDDDQGQTQTASVDVTADMIDPWYRRVSYSVPPLGTMPRRYLNQHSNPFSAIWAGTMQTYYFVAKTYVTMQRLIFTRSVGVEHMSGPVGIVHIGSQIARASKIDMLYFLALISANLAVINFLPLPIVDGGHMVFLFIELIKGAPVSLRTQVVTQMLGLVLIGTLFILITFQDVSKLLQ